MRKKEEKIYRPTNDLKNVEKVSDDRQKKFLIATTNDPEN